MNEEINRRQAVERVALILGGTLSTQLSAGLMGQTLNTGESIDPSKDQIELLVEVADIIIPTTDTPGAKAAGVEKFIVRLMRDCYDIKDQKFFYKGLAKIDTASQKAHSKNFIDLDLESKNAIILDATKSNKAFFKLVKKLTVAGYFTSEIGANQALAYLPIPGKFEGTVPLKPGQKAWAITR